MPRLVSRLEDDIHLPDDEWFGEEGVKSVGEASLPCILWIITEHKHNDRCQICVSGGRKAAYQISIRRQCHQIRPLLLARAIQNLSHRRMAIHHRHLSAQAPSALIKPADRYSYKHTCKSRNTRS